MIRPDWRTIQRPDLRQRPVALALAEATCSHGETALQHEPIVLLGSQVVQEVDGRKHVDLSGAEWHPQQCLGGAS